MKKFVYLILPVILLFVMVSCRSTIENMAVKSLAGMLSGSGTSEVFTSDDDPELISQALPLALKMYEMILEKDPENADLLAATGKNFVMYSAAFVQLPSDMLEDEQWQEADKSRKRAKKLYTRGRKYLLHSLDVKHPGFLDGLDSDDCDKALDMLTPEDVNTLYWASMGWFALVSTDPLDMELVTTVDKAVMLLYKALSFDDEDASLHGAFVQVLLSLPPAIIYTAKEKSPETSAFIDGYYKKAGVGDSAQDRALYHFNRNEEITGGQDPAPYITLATTIAVKNQDVDSFREYLNKALEIDPDDNPDSRLMIVIYREKAQWLLDHIENFFLVDF
jgi:predicted anti-sigma-YlaC factor YlaD